MVLRDDINNKTMLDECRCWALFQRLPVSTFHFFACNILIMQNAELGMAAFPTQFIITFVHPCQTWRPSQ